MFTVVSMCICWQSLKPVDYVMLTEQGNDVYCTKQVTSVIKGCGFAFYWEGGGEQSDPRGDR